MERRATTKATEEEERFIGLEFRGRDGMGIDGVEAFLWQGGGSGRG